MRTNIFTRISKETQKRLNKEKKRHKAPSHDAVINKGLDAMNKLATLTK